MPCSDVEWDEDGMDRGEVWAIHVMGLVLESYYVLVSRVFCDRFRKHGLLSGLGMSR